MENEDDTWLEKIVYTLSQEGNTNGTTEEYETLEVTVESGAGPIDKDGGFLVLRTKGWSINDSDELHKTLSMLEKGVCSDPKLRKRESDLEFTKEELDYLSALLLFGDKEGELYQCILNKLKIMKENETGKA